MSEESKEQEEYNTVIRLGRELFSNEIRADDIANWVKNQSDEELSLMFYALNHICMVVSDERSMRKFTI